MQSAACWIRSFQETRRPRSAAQPGDTHGENHNVMHFAAGIGPSMGGLSLHMSEGQLAEGPHDLKRLYEHFRRQGYEGIIAKRLDAPYRLAARDPDWRKRKPALTLDLALLGAVFSVTQKDKAGMFGSFVLGARNEDGGYTDVGDVQGLDAVRDVIWHTETFDVTSIRASTPMYLMARRIKAMGVKMVLSGEGSDEIFGGYLYFHKAPDPRAFHEETEFFLRVSV